MQICKAGLEVASISSLLKPLAACREKTTLPAIFWVKVLILIVEEEGKLGHFICILMCLSEKLLKAEFFQAASASFWSSAASSVLSLCCPFARPPEPWDPKLDFPVSDIGPGVYFGLFLWLSQWVLQWVSGSRRGIKRAACPGESRKEHVEGSSAPGEEPAVSDTQVSVSQQPNAIAKSQLWSRIALAGLLCVQDTGNNHFIGLSGGKTQQEKCTLF